MSEANDGAAVSPQPPGPPEAERRLRWLAENLLADAADYERRHGGHTPNDDVAALLAVVAALRAQVEAARRVLDEWAGDADTWPLNVALRAALAGPVGAPDEDEEGQP